MRSFEIGRERLKELRISKMETLERNLGEATHFLASEWLRFKDPHAAAWKTVASAFSGIRA
jgi:hypothetical protein